MNHSHSGYHTRQRSQSLLSIILLIVALFAIFLIAAPVRASQPQSQYSLLTSEPAAPPTRKISVPVMFDSDVRFAILVLNGPAPIPVITSVPLAQVGVTRYLCEKSCGITIGRTPGGQYANYYREREWRYNKNDAECDSNLEHTRSPILFQFKVKLRATFIGAGGLVYG